MQLTINGEIKAFETALENVQSLVEAMQLKGDRIAIELNREIVPRAAWAATAIRNGDRVEIVHFVGGGSR